MKTKQEIETDIEAKLSKQQMDRRNMSKVTSVRMFEAI